jgi:hypothetical protein
LHGKIRLGRLRSIPIFWQMPPSWAQVAPRCGHHKKSRDSAELRERINIDESSSKRAAIEGTNAALKKRGLKKLEAGEKSSAESFDA